MTKKTDDWELFTVSEIAEQDKVSEKTVRRAIDRGDLKVVRIGPSGRSVRVTAEDRRAYRALRRE